MACRDAIVTNQLKLIFDNLFVRFQPYKLRKFNSKIIFSYFSERHIKHSLFLFLTLPLFCVVVFSYVFDNVNNHLLYAQSNNNSSFGQQTELPTKPFARQEIKDDSSDWISLSTGNGTKGVNETDIKSVIYYSDGRFLYTTLWLSSFDNSPAKNMWYGMLVDADFNNSTGYQGIDYKSEIFWDNTRKNWTRVFNELSSIPGKEKVLEIRQNHTNDPGGEMGGFVNLFTDLKKMLSPNKFKIFFYAYSEGNESVPYILDAVRWAYVPPPEFTLTVSPDIIELMPGQDTTIEVRLNSTTELNPTVKFSHSNIPENVKLSIKYPEREVPPLGMATTPMTVTAENADPGPNTIFIDGELDFPTQKFDSPIKKNPGEKIGKIPIESQDVNTKVGFTLLIREPPGLQESMQGFISSWFNPLTSAYATISTIINGLLGWRIWKRNKQENIPPGETSSVDRSVGRPIH